MKRHRPVQPGDPVRRGISVDRDRLWILDRPPSRRRGRWQL